MEGNNDFYNNGIKYSPEKGEASLYLWNIDYFPKKVQKPLTKWQPDFSRNWPKKISADKKRIQSVFVLRQAVIDHFLVAEQKLDDRNKCSTLQGTEDFACSIMRSQSEQLAETICKLLGRRQMQYSMEEDARLK